MNNSAGGPKPAGDGPYGNADLAGNVWEWTGSLYKPYPYDAGDGREDAAAEGFRALRGGSWLCRRGYARAAYRLLSERPQPLLRFSAGGAPVPSK